MRAHLRTKPLETSLRYGAACLKDMRQGQPDAVMIRRIAADLEHVARSLRAAADAIDNPPAPDRPPVH